jgi:small conductance mechanosensitive channel
VIAGSTIAASIAYYYSSVKKFFPSIYIDPIYAVIVLIGGYLGIRIISAAITRYAEPRIGVTRGEGLKNFFQIVAFLALVSAVFAIFGVNITNALIAAGFLGIVLGLAAQQVLGNIFAGISLLFSRPFDIGDRITMATWQYGVLAPTYQHEYLVPGYTGVVQHIGIFYTELMLDEGVPAAVPNSVVIGALVLDHSKVQRRTVRVRMDVDRNIRFEKFKNELFNALSRNGEEGNGGNNLIDTDKLKAEIIDVGPSTYHVAITAWANTSYEEPIKTLIIKNAMEVQNRLNHKEEKKEELELKKKEETG